LKAKDGSIRYQYYHQRTAFIDLEVPKKIRTLMEKLEIINTITLNYKSKK